MFAVGYGADATRKSNRQCQIRFPRARISVMLILSQVLFLLSLLNNLECRTNYYSLKISTTLCDIDFELTGCMTYEYYLM